MQGSHEMTLSKTHNTVSNLPDSKQKLILTRKQKMTPKILGVKQSCSFGYLQIYGYHFTLEEEVKQ